MQDFENVKRYETFNDYYGIWNDGKEMFETTVVRGDWVSAQDYDALLKEYKEFKWMMEELQK